MINEGVVDISPEEEKAIDSFLKDLERFFNKKTSNIDVNDFGSNHDQEILSKIDRYVNDVLAPKYKLDGVKWLFVYLPDFRTKAAYAAEQKRIYVNLIFAVNDPHSPLHVQKINFKDVSVHVYHEWTHYKQDLLYRKSTGTPYTTSKIYAGHEYYDTPEEQMAFARGELEWIKHNLGKKQPEKILNWVKKWGMSQAQEIAALKKSNPKAYRKMLKYLVLFVLKKQAQEELSKGKKEKKVK